MPDDSEFLAMQSVYNALEPLPEDAQIRVFVYVGSRLGINAVPKGKADDSPGNGVDSAKQEPKKFEEIGELFDAYDPQTDAEKALISAYWSALHDGEEGFDSQSLNSMLKNLGHGVSNITRALGSLSSQKPALVIQTRKSGSTKQARKTYKITRSGIAAVNEKVGRSIP